MKFALVYFSGTGSTAKFASDIAIGIKENQHQVDLLRIKKGKKIDLSSYDIIGVGAPPFSYRAPRLATRLIRRMDFGNKPYFVFCTSGGGPGNVLWSLYRAARKSGGPCLGYLSGVGVTNLRSWMPRKNNPTKTISGLNSAYYSQNKTFQEYHRSNDQKISYFQETISKQEQLQSELLTRLSDIDQRTFHLEKKTGHNYSELK